MPPEREDRRHSSFEERTAWRAKAMAGPEKTWVDKLLVPLLISAILGIAGTAFKMHTDSALMRQELDSVHKSLDNVASQVSKQNEEFGRAIAIISDRQQRAHPEAQ